MAGTIQQEKLNSFERLLFRATRGNMYLRQVPVGLIRDPATGEEQDKSVFVIFFAGERSRTKVHKVSQPAMIKGYSWVTVGCGSGLEFAFILERESEGMWVLKGLVKQRNSSTRQPSPGSHPEPTPCRSARSLAPTATPSPRRWRARGRWRQR